MNINISSAQLRAARSILRLKVSEVSKSLSMGNATINRIESDDINGTENIKVNTLKRLVEFYQNQGIEFQDHNIIIFHDKIVA